MKSIDEFFLELELAQQKRLIDFIQLPASYPNLCTFAVGIDTEPKIPILLQYIRHNYPIHILQQLKYANSIVIKLSW